jgi:hypothetical protein
MSNSNVIYLTATEDVPLSFTEIGSFIARLRLILRPTVAERCDLLNINTANREGLSEIRRNGCAHL